MARPGPSNRGQLHIGRYFGALRPCFVVLYTTVVLTGPGSAWLKPKLGLDLQGGAPGHPHAQDREREEGHRRAAVDGRGDPSPARQQRRRLRGRGRRPGRADRRLGARRQPRQHQKRHQGRAAAVPQGPRASRSRSRAAAPEPPRHRPAADAQAAGAAPATHTVTSATAEARARGRLALCWPPRRRRPPTATPTRPHADAARRRRRPSSAARSTPRPPSRRSTAPTAAAPAGRPTVPKKEIVACNRTGTEKYHLAVAKVVGKDIKGANVGADPTTGPGPGQPVVQGQRPGPLDQADEAEAHNHGRPTRCASSSTASSTARPPSRASSTATRRSPAASRRRRPRSSPTS